MYPFTKNLKVAMKECAKLNWTLLAIKPYSAHKNDNHLAIILTCKADAKVKGGLRFQTHGCNSTSGGFIFWDHWFPEFTNAIINFNQRGNK